MTVSKRQTHESKMTDVQFGKAMAELDLSSIPQHNRAKAIREHMTKIMADQILDPDVKAQLKYADFRNKYGL